MAAAPRFKKAVGRFKSRFKQAKISSERRTENETKQMEREEAEEEKDQKDVERSENKKLKLDKSDQRLINSAIRDLRFCQAALKTWRLKAAFKDINDAIFTVQMLMRSETMKSRLTQLEEREEVRDEQVTRGEEMQTMDEARQTKVREQEGKRG